MALFTACSNGPNQPPANFNDNNNANGNDNTSTNGEGFPPIDLSEPERELTAWEKVAAGVDDDGTVSKEVALQAFALTMGDIPGVTPPAADVVGASCGTVAINWVSLHADELTVEERAAIAAVINSNGESDQPKVLADIGCTVDNEGISADGAGAEQYRAILDQELANVEQALGRPLGIPVYFTLGLRKTGSETVAWASPQSSGDCNTGTATSCRVELFVNAPEVTNDAQLRATLAHELVHCFQFTLLAPSEAVRQPAWILEGFPDFIGLSLHPTAKRVSFVVYAETPLRRLFTRTYDAQGFFFHLANIGVDVAGRYAAAFQTKSNSAAFAHLVGSNESTFGETWAASYALDPARGDAWNMPDAPADAVPKYSSGVVVNGKSYSGNPGPAGTRISHLDFDADIIRFKAGDNKLGRVSWDDGGEILLAQMDGQEYCRKAGGCECPEGTTGTPPQTPIPALGAIVSVSGTTITSTIDVIGISLDEYCLGVDPCVVGTWVSDRWTMPGPTAGLSGTGGENARVTISADGQAQWNFDNMQPIATYDEQIDLTTELYSRGTATGRVAAGNGTWSVTENDFSNLEGFAINNIIGEYPLSGGPGLFVLISDGTYTCSSSTLNYITIDPVEEKPITVTLHKQ
jgi:hypothetical protein